MTFSLGPKASWLECRKGERLAKKNVGEYPLEQRIDIMNSVVGALRDATTSIQEVMSLRRIFLKGQHDRLDRPG